MAIKRIAFCLFVFWLFVSGILWDVYRFQNYRKFLQFRMDDLKSKMSALEKKRPQLHTMDYIHRKAIENFGFVDDSTLVFVFSNE